MAPRKRAACASSTPIRPLLRLLRKRAGSMDSWVGPAETRTDIPDQSRVTSRVPKPRLNTDAAANSINSGSAMRPSPTRSQANRPDAGNRGTTPGKDWICSQLRCTAGWRHMAVFIAGAAMTGASVANRTLASSPSAEPWLQRARLLALRGATMVNSAHSANSMCSGLDAAGFHWSASR